MTKDYLTTQFRNFLGNVIDVRYTKKEDYPAYCATERDAVLAKLQQYWEVENPIVIGFSTDQHVNPNNMQTFDNVLPNLRTLRDLTKEFPFNICVLGGDSCSGINIPSQQDCVQQVSRALEGASCPVIHLVGNHDGKQDISTVSASTVFQSHRTEAMKNHTVTTVDSSLNCYYDDMSCKVRFIMIMSQALNGYGADKTKAFLSNALATLPQGYDAIIFSHHPLGDLTDDKTTRVDDWNEPLGWGSIVNPYADRIIACINGHVHADKHEIKDGILYLSTTCAGIYELNDGSTRTAGTVDVTAYDVFVIDRATKTIHCIRYGNGNDRNLPYYIAPEPTYTNAIPTSIGTDSTVFNSVGYKLDTRLNSSGGEAERVGCGVTGFIPAKAGDVIRLKNCELKHSGTSYDYIGMYTSSFGVVTSKYPSVMVDNWDGQFVVDDNDNVTQFTVPNNSGIAYIRISASGIDSDAVITVNEEINN